MLASLVKSLDVYGQAHRGGLSWGVGGERAV